MKHCSLECLLTSCLLYLHTHSDCAVNCVANLNILFEGQLGLGCTYNNIIIIKSLSLHKHLVVECGLCLLSVIVQPLLSEEEMEDTRKAVAEFGRPGGEGEKLQEKLLEKAKINDNWVSCSFVDNT